MCLAARSAFVPSIFFLFFFCESEENSWKPFGNSVLHLFAFKFRLFQESYLSWVRVSIYLRLLLL